MLNTLLCAVGHLVQQLVHLHHPSLPLCVSSMKRTRKGLEGLGLFSCITRGQYMLAELSSHRIVRQGRIIESTAGY
jgi:hypothetical protein